MAQTWWRRWIFLLVGLGCASLLQAQEARTGAQGESQGAGSSASMRLAPGQQPADFSRGSIRFIGNATVLLEFAGFTILTDPNFLHKGEHVHLGYGLRSERLTEPAMRLEDLPPIDLVLLSHLHGDHFDQLVQEKLPRDLPIVSTPGAVEGLKKLGFTRTTPLEQWDTLSIRKGDALLRISAMPARHGPPVLAAALPQTMGSMLDFVTPDGMLAYRAYITGDTMMFDAIEAIPRRYPGIDLALLHLGGTKILSLVTVTMDAKEGVRMMQVVAPRHAIPIHYNDYDVFKSSIEEFEQEATRAGLREKLTFLKHGERFEFRARGK